MALSKCKECGAQISAAAKACPQCGAPPPKKTSMFTWLVAGFIVIAVGMSLTRPDAPPKPQKTAEQLAVEQKQEAEFQRVVLVAKLVRRSAKDPDSFNLTYAGMTDKGAVCLEYRAKNSFNAVVPGRYVAAGKANGDTAELWNRHCANQSIRDYSTAKHAL